jgi:hypothetical protein
MFAPDTPNPSAGGLPGAMIYAGTDPGACGCDFVESYPYAFGPRVGASYQLNPQTVIRGGWGITYAQTNGGQSNIGGTLGAGGWNTINFETPAFGEPGATLREGLSYNRDDLFRVLNDPGFRPSPGQINSPSNWYHPDAGKLPKTNQWSISVQREITRDLMVEVAYVGNRGSRFQANNLISLNALSEERLASFGLNINNASDRGLLRARLDSPAAAARGFNKAPYAGYSMANTVAQSLRPFPQFGNLGVSGAPLGETRYDSLQLKGVKRYSRGLSLTATLTWQNERTNMGGINNVFDKPTDQWAVSSLSEPLITVLAFNYEVPAMGESRIVRALVGGWTFSGIMRYASGLPIPVPAAQNQHASLVFQNTRMNRVSGEPLFLKDLNSGDVDPNKDFVLNPKAWVDPGQGQWGTSLAFYDDYRYQRRPEEQLGVGRSFRISDRARFEIRAEIFNPFNRTFMNNPVATNPLQTQRVDAQGKPIAGFGRIDTGSIFGPPRSGQIVTRLSW